MRHKAKDLCDKYGIKLKWIPKREIKVEDIDEFLCGTKIPILAKRID
ncbi:MAG: hypothetical protein ACRCXA_08415 [Peptostreptococcaceae bacterium]